MFLTNRRKKKSFDSPSIRKTSFPCHRRSFKILLNYNPVMGVQWGIIERSNENWSAVRTIQNGSVFAWMASLETISTIRWPAWINWPGHSNTLKRFVLVGRSRRKDVECSRQTLSNDFTGNLLENVVRCLREGIRGLRGGETPGLFVGVVPFLCGTSHSRHKRQNPFRPYCAAAVFHLSARAIQISATSSPLSFPHLFSMTFENHRHVLLPIRITVKESFSDVVRYKRIGGQLIPLPTKVDISERRNDFVTLTARDQHVVSLFSY